MRVIIDIPDDASDLTIGASIEGVTEPTPWEAFALRDIAEHVGANCRLVLTAEAIRRATHARENS